MRTNVYTLGFVGLLGAAACSPADSNQPYQQQGPGPVDTNVVTPVGPGTGVVNPTGPVQPVVNPQPTSVGPVDTNVAVNPQPTGVNPTPTDVGPTPTGVDPGPAEVCPTGDNLAVLHTNGNWIGCDPDLSTDNPGGVQGAFYLYGDGTSCDDTAVPCDASGCHLTGASIVGDPADDWGCGLGLGLNTDAAEKKHAYTAATCFDVEIAGSTGGLDLRIGFTQHDGTGSTSVAPFRNIAPFTNGWSGEVCITDVSCPSWSIDPDLASPLCEVGTGVYDLQIQVAAGELDADYDLTLTKLVPKTGSDVVVNEGMGPQMLTGVGSSCDNYHNTRVGADGKEYILINNVWNPTGGQQCIDYNGTSFTITTQTNNSTSTAPASFPAVILGCKAGDCSAGSSGLPIQVSAIQSIETGFKIKAAGIPGTFNAAYDIWVHSTNNLPGNNPDYFVMLWPWTQGTIQPAGSITGNVTIEGVKWDVWTGGVGEHGGRYIAYQATNTESLHVDLKPFFDDAVANRGLPATSHLINIQAGFEIWSGGVGLASEYFYANVR